MICSSVKRLGFMVHPFPGDGRYPVLAEITGLRSTSARRLGWVSGSKKKIGRGDRPVWQGA